jgi:hypothetical protein
MSKLKGKEQLYSWCNVYSTVIVKDVSIPTSGIVDIYSVKVL